MTSRKFVRRVLLAAALCHTPILDTLTESVLATSGNTTKPGNRVASPPDAAVHSQGYRLPTQVDQFGRPVAAPPKNATQVQQVQYQPMQQQPASSYAGRNQAAGNQTAGHLQRAPQQASGNPSVVNELNRLFIENGQQPPSMREQDLPYANSLQPQTIRPKAQPAKKPNVFQKFVSRISGKDSQKAPAETPAASGAGLSNLSALPPTHAPNSGSAPGAPQMRTQAASMAAGNPPQQGTYQPRPGTASNTSRPQPGSNNQPQQRAYVQPGPAPAFMQPYPTAQRPGTTSVQPQVSAVPVARTIPAAVPPAAVPPASTVKRAVDDDFVDPFASSGDTGHGDEVLDLDALIEIPRADAATAVEAPVKVQESAAVAAKEMPARQSASPATSGQENPFTGVRLDVSDDQFFEDSTGRATLNESAGRMLNESLPPIEEFDTELPGLPLGSAEERSSQTADAEPVPTGRTTLLPHPSESKQHIPQLDNERLQQAAEQHRRERQRALILSRSSQTGFKGFCPVQLRDQRELADADPSLTATFGLKSYSFSSREAKAAFESDPSRYAPAAGGSDVVLLVNGGEEQTGMLDYSLWYRDRLYMFRSRETMALFSHDPARYANQY